MCGECHKCNAEQIKDEEVWICPICTLHNLYYEKVNKKTYEGWINVKDKLPEIGESVGFTYDGENISKEHFYDHKYRIWKGVNKYDWEYPVKTIITHWKPPIKKPKVGE
jgi:hypothetical protein